MKQKHLVKTKTPLGAKYPVPAPEKIIRFYRDWHRASLWLSYRTTPEPSPDSPVVNEPVFHKARLLERQLKVYFGPIFE
jgi:hypothetical protein